MAPSRAPAAVRCAILIASATIACATGPKPRLSESEGDGVGRAEPASAKTVADVDTDADGIPDRRDQCPDVPEDKDNFEDDDGCPDPDNDRDRIPDVDDKCPNDPETYNNQDDADGCPDKGSSGWGHSALRFADVPFARGRAVVELGSVPIVDGISATITQYCAAVELQGHASDDEPRPRALAAARAAAVRAALMERNIRADWLKIRSLGATHPLCGQKVELCRVRNRRVAVAVLDLRICK